MLKRATKAQEASPTLKTSPPRDTDEQAASRLAKLRRIMHQVA
jgi:hypothetical protein